MRANQLKAFKLTWIYLAALAWIHASHRHVRLCLPWKFLFLRWANAFENLLHTRTHKWCVKFEGQNGYTFLFDNNGPTSIAARIIFKWLFIVFDRKWFIESRCADEQQEYNFNKFIDHLTCIWDVATLHTMNCRISMAWIHDHDTHTFIYFLQGNRGYIGCAPVTFDLTCCTLPFMTADKKEIIIISSYDEWHKLSILFHIVFVACVWKRWYWIWSITNLAFAINASVCVCMCDAQMKPNDPIVHRLAMASDVAVHPLPRTTTSTRSFSIPTHYVFLIYAWLHRPAKHCLPENISFESTKNSTAFCSSHHFYSFIIVSIIYHTENFLQQTTIIMACEWDARRDA